MLSILCTYRALCRREGGDRRADISQDYHGHIILNYDEACVPLIGVKVTDVAAAKSTNKYLLALQLYIHIILCYYFILSAVKNIRQANSCVTYCAPASI